MQQAVGVLLLGILGCLVSLACGEDLTGAGDFELKEIKSRDELATFLKSSSVHVVLFYHGNKGNIHALLSRSYLEIRYYEILVAAFDCGMPNQPDILQECKSGKREVHAYNPNAKFFRHEAMVVRTLYNLDAILGHFLFFKYQEHVQIIVTEQDFQDLMDREKGHHDVVLMAFAGLGDVGHRIFMEAVVQFQNKFVFAFTTESSLAEKLGAPENFKFAAWHVACKSVAALESSCKETMFFRMPSHALSLSEVITFIRLIGVPYVSDVLSNGTSVYQKNDFAIPVKEVFMFVDNDQDYLRYKEILERLLPRGGRVDMRGVMVKSMEHKDLLKTFGLSSNEVYPTLVLKCISRAEIVYEKFPADHDFTEKHIEEFLALYDHDAMEGFAEAARAVPIVTVNHFEWIPPSNSAKLVVMMACSSDYEFTEPCEEASRFFRRLSRTIFATVDFDLEIVYVDFTGDPVAARNMEIPALHIYKDGQNRVLKAFSRTDTPLQWVNRNLGLNLELLPLSGSDMMKLLPGEKGTNENQVLLASGDDSLERFQEDEVSKEVTKLQKNFYDNPVIHAKLDTFNATISSAELVFVFFYVPWDAESYIFHSAYDAVEKKLRSDSPDSGPSVLLVKVNAYGSDLLRDQENILTFPTVRIYRHGKHIGDYKRFLDEDSLMRTVRLLQQPRVTELKHESEVELFTRGKHPMPAAATVTAVVLGLFASSESKEMSAFLDLATSYHGDQLFAFASGSLAKSLLTAKYNVDADNAIVVSRIFDEHSPYSVLSDLSPGRTRPFLSKALLPSFGLLTAKAFPHYASVGEPFVICFVSFGAKEEDQFWSFLSTYAKLQSKPNVLLTWMDLDNPAAVNIRRKYVGVTKAKSDLVVLDQAKNLVYRYLGVTDMKAVSQWIDDAAAGKLQPTTRLPASQWKPLREGFDFLTYIEKGLPRVSLGGDPEDLSDADRSAVAVNGDNQRGQQGKRMRIPLVDMQQPQEELMDKEMAEPSQTTAYNRLSDEL